MFAASTTTALLEALIDPANQPVWVEFDARFRPIIFGFARRLRLGEEDAADVVQETLSQFARDFREGKYDRTRGRLHSWIMGIAAHRAADVLRRRAGQHEQPGDSLIAKLPDSEGLSVVWDNECRTTVLRRALQELRDSTRLAPNTIEAFELLALNEVAPADVATRLGMSLDSVYAAKNRCLSQLRSILGRLNEIYEL